MVTVGALSQHNVDVAQGENDFGTSVLNIWLKCSYNNIIVSLRCRVWG